MPPAPAAALALKPFPLEGGRVGMGVTLAPALLSNMLINSQINIKSHPHPNPSPLKGEGLKQSVARPQ